MPGRFAEPFILPEAELGDWIKRAAYQTRKNLLGLIAHDLGQRDGSPADEDEFHDAPVRAGTVIFTVGVFAGGSVAVSLVCLALTGLTGRYA